MAGAADFGTFTLGIVPWLGVLVVGPALARRRRGRRVQAVGVARTGLALAAIALIVTVLVIAGVYG